MFFLEKAIDQQAFNASNETTPLRALLSLLYIPLSETTDKESIKIVDDIVYE